MRNENTVLVFNMDAEKPHLQLHSFSEQTIPEKLNGESGFHIYHVRLLTELILDQLKENGDYDLTEEDIEAMAESACYGDGRNGYLGGFVRLDKKAVADIYRLAL